MLLNNVTLGTATFDRNDGPTLGNDVRVGAGARILGSIVIGDRCRIGANAVVTRSYPADQVLVGVPAQPLGGR
jgi:serine acetyltransferase